MSMPLRSVWVQSGVRAVWKKVIPILIELLPGIAVGASVLASLKPGWIKFARTWYFCASSCFKKRPVTTENWAYPHPRFPAHLSHPIEYGSERQANGLSLSRRAIPMRQTKG